MNKEQLKQLTIKILKGNLDKNIAFINTHSIREVMPEADKISFAITTRQFGVMTDFITFYDGMRYRGWLKFKIDGWNFAFSYIHHPRGREAYSVICTHDNYDENFWFTHDVEKYVKEGR